MKNNNIKIGIAANYLFVFCGTFYIFFALIPKDPVIHGDVIRSLLLVQDCLKNYGCHLRASPDTGSILGISHGAIFLHFLVLVHYLGGGVKECYIIIALCAAVAITLLYYLAKKLYGRHIGLITAVLYLFIMVSKAGLELLWNPVLMHLPAVLFLFSSLCYIKTKKLIYFIVSAFVLSLGIQTHLTFLMHFIGFLYLIFLTPKEKRFTLLIFGIGIIIGLIMTASFAIFQNIYLPSSLGDGEPVERSFSFFLTAIVVGCISVSAVYLNWRSKKVVNHITLFLLIDYCFWWLILSLFQYPSHRYWYSLFPGIILLTVESFYILLSYVIANKRRLKNAINVITVLLFICCLTALSVIPSFHIADRDAQKTRMFTMDDAKEIANELILHERCTYDKVFRHLRGGEHYHFLLQGLGYTFPMSSKSGAFGPDNSCEGDFAVFKTDADKVKKLPSKEWTVFKKGRRALVMYRYRPYLKWDKFKACFAGQTSDFASPCLEKEYSFTPSANPELMASRWPFGMLELAHSSPFTLYVQVPIVVPSHQPSRTIFIPTYKDYIDKCRGFIEDVSGVHYKGKLPTNEIIITSDNYTQSGKIIFSWDFGTSTCSLNANKWMPPPVLEISKESFHAYDIFDKTPAYSEIKKQEESKRKILISTLFKETKNSRLAAPNFEPNVIQNKIITVPLRYVIVVMALLILCTIASILICVYYFRTCDEKAGGKNA